MRTIVLPTSIPTCCEFGGSNLDVLYVTSAKLRKLKEPLAGALFAIDVGVKGLTLPPFKG
jgi:sugar lactone lactonase YvrE